MAEAGAAESTAEATMDLAFTFACKLDGFADEHRVDFSFKPQGGGKLGRIMAIAERSGTGKVRLLSRLAQVLSGLGAGDPGLASRQAGDEGADAWKDPKLTSCTRVRLDGDPGIILRSFNAS